MRAFVAIEMNDPVRDALDALSIRLRESAARVSWVKPKNVHLTLRFLGEVDEAQVDRLGEILAVAYQSVPPFTLTVGDVGAFPNVRRPQVVWVGVGPADGPLCVVQRVAEEAARRVGLPPETKRFSPHVTLGRVRDDRAGDDLRVALERENGFVAGDITVQRVALLRSTLSPKGSIYTPIREFPFPWT